MRRRTASPETVQRAWLIKAMVDAELMDDTRNEPMRSRRKKHGGSSDAGRSDASTASERRRRRVKSEGGGERRSSERGEAISPRYDESQKADDPREQCSSSKCPNPSDPSSGSGQPRSILLRGAEQSSSPGRRVNFAPVLEDSNLASPDNSNYSASNYSAFGREGVVGPVRSDQGSDQGSDQYADADGYSLDGFLSPKALQAASQQATQAAATKRGASSTPQPESKQVDLKAPTPTSAMDRAFGQANAVESNPSFPRWFDGCAPAHALRTASTHAYTSQDSQLLTVTLIIPQVRQMVSSTRRLGAEHDQHHAERPRLRPRLLRLLRLRVRLRLRRARACMGKRQSSLVQGKGSFGSSTVEAVEASCLSLKIPGPTYFERPRVGGRSKRRSPRLHDSCNAYCVVPFACAGSTRCEPRAGLRTPKAS